MLATAIIAPPAALYWLAAMQSNMIGVMMESPPPDWGSVSILAVGVGLWLAGVIWMIRIFRGPSDNPPPWRYRDR